VEIGLSEALLHVVMERIYVLYALLNDIFQRAITLNKLEQRRNLAHVLSRMNLKRGEKVLDFGCGTGLFAEVFRRRNLEYIGYDIDSRLTSYAGNLYSDCRFTTSRDLVQSLGPFHLTVLNCCAHHIPDELLIQELAFINCLLAEDGTLLLIDLLDPGESCGLGRRLLMQLERGAFLRSEQRYVSLIRDVFSITGVTRGRLHVLSLTARWNPFHYESVVIEAHKAGVQKSIRD